MGAVAKRLVGRAAAGTPVVGLAGLDVHRDWTAPRDRWLRHEETVPVALQRSCSGGSMLPAGGRREVAGHGATGSSPLWIRGRRWRHYVKQYNDMRALAATRQPWPIAA